MTLMSSDKQFSHLQEEENTCGLKPGKQKQTDVTRLQRYIWDEEKFRKAIRERFYMRCNKRLKIRSSCIHWVPGNQKPPAREPPGMSICTQPVSYQTAEREWAEKCRERQLACVPRKLQVVSQRLRRCFLQSMVWTPHMCSSARWLSCTGRGR